MKILIIASGSAVNYKTIKELFEEADYIICADGGATHLSKVNLIPDVIIGDLDSIEQEVLSLYGGKEVEFKTFPAKKDKTDFELSIDYALELGASELIITSATGTRLDHTIANIMLLYPLLMKGVKAKIIDNNNEIYMVNDSMQLKKEEYTYVSIIPLFDNVLGVTTKGFEYETEGIDFKLASTLGISNSLVAEEGSIKIDKGVCLVIKSKD